MKTMMLMLITLFSVVGCAGSASKNAKWQEVDNAADIVCIPPASPMLFVANLRETKSKTDLAPESIMVTDAVTDTANTFIVRKELRRFIPSMSSYSTLSALEVTMGIKEDGISLTVTPLRKKEYQVSVIGEWPIPKMDVDELARYLGSGCVVNTKDRSTRAQ
jgi:hypothetical protein